MLVLKKQLEFEAILFILIGAFVGYFLLMYSNHAKVRTLASNNIPTFPVIAGLPTTIPLSSTPTPTFYPQTPSQITETDFTPTVTTTSQPSSDGTKTLTLKTIQNKNGTKTFDITTSDNQSFMYSKTFSGDESLTIPFNTWSPNNRYFFIQKNTATQATFMVFNDNGDPFANGNAYLDLSGDFTNHAPNALFDQATGWAADNLIIITTKLTDGSEGTSYWYEVPSESVISLSTKF